MSAKIVTVERWQGRRSGPSPARAAMTPVWPAGRRPTFTAPKSDPGGRTREQTWDLYSRDGLWHYQRIETGRRFNRWAVWFLPTGQTRDGFPGSRAARTATSAGLVEQLRTEAFGLALRTPLHDPRRSHGHRMLAVHLRLAATMQGEDAEHRCECGGYLAVVTRDGDLAHLDACDRCYRYGKALPTEACPSSDRHRFCGDPRAAGWTNGCGLWRDDCCHGTCFAS